MIFWVVGGVVLGTVGLLWALIAASRKDATEDSEQAEVIKDLTAFQKTTERMQDAQSRPVSGDADAARERMRNRDPDKR